ncbi:hypothetical protein, partial [Fusobacterium sp. MFO224]|uniref:hypothetical protein n=1 Tax=Fusobacterium sp. MFO224 TaxID=3378070 RepID=UPI003853D70C
VHLRDSLAELEKDFETVINIKDQYERAQFYHTNVIPRINHLVDWADALELICEKNTWPFPVYEDLLFKL